MPRIHPVTTILLGATALCLWACPASEPTEDPGVAQDSSPSQPDVGGESSSARAAGWTAALSAYEEGKYGEALQAMETEPRLASDARLRVAKACLLLFARRFDEASELVAGLVGDPVAATGIRVVRAHLLINTKDYEGAQELVGDVAAVGVSEDAGAPEGYSLFIHELACLAMAWSEANRNRHVRAIRWFDQILAGQANDLLGLLGRGNSLIALNLLTDAEQTLQRVLVDYPSNPYALAELGMIHLKLGDEQAAELHFQKALARDDARYTCPHEGLGLLYLRQGRSDQAKEHLQRAIRINPDIEYKKYNGLARIYLEEGNRVEAERLLQKSIANFPHDGEARRLLEELRTSASGPTGGDLP